MINKTRIQFNFQQTEKAEMHAEGCLETFQEALAKYADEINLQQGTLVVLVNSEVNCGYRLEGIHDDLRERIANKE